MCQSNKVGASLSICFRMFRISASLTNLALFRIMYFSQCLVNTRISLSLRRIVTLCLRACFLVLFDVVAFNSVLYN